MRRTLASATLVLCLTVASLAVGLEPAAATDAPPQPLPQVSQFQARDFQVQANTLPQGLVEAVRRDLKISAAQYLANASAAVEDVTVVKALSDRGLRVLGSSMDGTSLKVYVSSAAEVATVQSTGAIAVVGAPPAPQISGGSFHTVADLYGGQGYYFQDSTSAGYRCSIGFNGRSISTGAPQFVTAGHCATKIAGSSYAITQTSAGVNLSVGTQPIGLPVAGASQFGNGYEYGLVAETGAGFTPQAGVLTWGYGTGAPTASSPLPVIGQSAAIVGASLCKSGSTSGWTCGTITGVDYGANVSGASVNAILATTCLLPGDSGGGALIGQYAVGIDSGSNYAADPTNSNKCTGTGESVFFPMVSAAGGPSVQSAVGGIWELNVSLSVVPGVSNGATSFVTALYADFLNRRPSADETRGWGVQVDQGLPSGAVSQGFVNSAEYRLIRIDAAYRTILGREPDAGGRIGWLDGMQRGALTTDDVEQNFYASQEYFNNQGDNNEAFVAAVYQALLGRAAGPAEISGWAARAASSGRSTVISLIWSSVETARQRVTLMYSRYLGRVPEYDAVVGWGDYDLRVGDSALRSAISGSQEYWDRAARRFPVG
ncbi:MAG: DUF4214 domain-containing protein [Lacisediminihabitans sp.]